LVTNASSYVPATRRVKSKMPCLPGFAPVMNDDHAGNVTGGVVERRTPEAPAATRRRSVGISPASMSGRARSHVAPSRPTIAITRCRLVHVAERTQALFGRAVDRRLAAAHAGCDRATVDVGEPRGERRDLLVTRAGQVALLARI